MILKKILHVIAIIWGFIQTTEAIGTMTSVYLNPVGGNDTNAGTLTYPVQSWDKALQLAADNATIYLAWGAVPVTSGVTVIDGNQYGAVNITVSQNPGYTGGLFAIADGATGTFSKTVLKQVTSRLSYMILRQVFMAVVKLSRLESISSRSLPMVARLPSGKEIIA